MNDPSTLIRAGMKLWNPGGAPLPLVKVQFTDTTAGQVTVTVFETNRDGVNTSAQWISSYANTQSYTPTSGATAGQPLDGPPGDARIQAIAKACATLLDQQMIPAILAAGGTWP